MKIKVSMDSAADLSKELIQKHDISVVPFTVHLGDEERLDGINITGAQLLEYVEETDKLPKTAAPSELAYQEHFEKLLEDNDYVIHFCISSELSVAYANAKRAGEKFNNKVKVIDSRVLSSGIAIQGLYACDLIEEGKSIDEIVKRCEEVVPYTQTSFTIDKLDLLHKGGRCSGTTKLLAMALSIKPSMQMQNGKLNAYRKYMMRKFEIVVKKYVFDTLKEFNNFDSKRVFVTHTPVSKEVVETVKDILKDKFEEIIECDAGATVSSHCGKNTLGIIYINKKRD